MHNPIRRYTVVGFFTLTLTLIVILFFYLLSHKLCSAVIFDLFIPLIILNTFRFTSFILLGTYIQPNGSSIELQLPSQLFTLMMMDSNEVYQDSDR